MTGIRYVTQWMLLATLLALPAVEVRAQATQPGSASPARATVSAAGSSGSESTAVTADKNAQHFEIVRPGQTGQANSPTTRRSGTPGEGGIETSRVLLALAVVIGLIFAMRYVGRRFFPAAAGAKASQVIRVLSRSAVAPRQQFLLVQVGRRLLVVGDCGTSMSPLAEITDPDEVAALVGQVDAEKTDSVSKAFGSLFGKARQPFEAMTSADALAVTDDDEEDMPALAGAGGMSVNRDDHENVSEVRGELSGLMDRVRVLSKQFKR